MKDSVTSVAYYRVKPGKIDEFLEVIVVGEEGKTNGPLVVEIFDWADESASGRAHTHPRVSEVWEAMGPLCESRAGRPPFEFANLRRLEQG